MTPGERVSAMRGVEIRRSDRRSDHQLPVDLWKRLSKRADRGQGVKRDRIVHFGDDAAAAERGAAGQHELTAADHGVSTPVLRSLRRNRAGSFSNWFEMRVIDATSRRNSLTSSPVS